MNFIVLDNVISEKYSQYLFNRCAQLKWSFVQDISYGTTDNGKNSPGFSYNFYLDKKFSASGETILSPEYNLIVPMFLECFDKLGKEFSIDDIFRSRARLTINRPELPDANRIDAPHVDYSIPHWVLLYYVNNTDGNTVFFENQQIVERIAPRRGRVVLFDGSIVHASSCSTLSPRIVINTNIRMVKE